MGFRVGGSATAIRYGNNSRLIFNNLPAISASFWIDGLVLTGDPGFFEITTPGGSARIEAVWDTGDQVIRAGGRALDSDSFQTIDSNIGVLDSDRHHIVIVFDYTNDEAFIYVDGELVGSDLSMGWTAGNCSNTAPRLADIFSANNLSNESDADYFDFRFYGRALSSEEVQTIYASEGLDDIIDSLELWAKGIEGASNDPLTIASVKDYSENDWAAFSVSGGTMVYADDLISIS